MNRTILIGAAATALVATPASATGGLVCQTAGQRPLSLFLVTSHTAVSSVVSVRLNENGRHVPVAIAQSWLEPNELRLDLTDTKASRHELRLVAKKNGSVFDGSLWRGSKRRWVRCRED